MSAWPAAVRRMFATFAVAIAVVAGGAGAAAEAAAGGTKWVTTWTAASHGPYPIGNPAAQPEQKFAFPDPERGADDQSFRLVVRPSLWGSRVRLRFSNAFGQRPLALDGVHVGLQSYAGHVVRGTGRAVGFEGRPSVSIPAGEVRWSDPVRLDWLRDPQAPAWVGRKLAVSFHVPGPSGPMTWHAKALQTSYVTAPKAGPHGADESDTAFVYGTASWFFLDAVDTLAPAGTPVVVCLGDSITDGTSSTMNGDDRWPDVLAQRLHERPGPKVAVVNQGIGGNRVVGPPDYARSPIPGGPGAVDRLERDVLSLSGVTQVIWMEGINDYGAANASVEAVTAGFRDGVERLKANGIRVVGATLTSARNATNAAYGTDEVDRKRQQTNDFIRRSGTFDAVVDFDAATLDSATGELRAEMQPNGTTGGPGDKLHPNRVGYAAMANAIDLGSLLPTAAPGRPQRQAKR